MLTFWPFFWVFHFSRPSSWLQCQLLCQLETLQVKRIKFVSSTFKFKGFCPVPEQRDFGEKLATLLNSYSKCARKTHFFNQKCTSAVQCTNQALKLVTFCETNVNNTITLRHRWARVLIKVLESFIKISTVKKGLQNQIKHQTSF